jgi:signal transduction histidine kinase
MNNWRSSAAYRIAFANFAGFALVLAAVGLVLFGAMHIAFTRQLDAMIFDEAQTLVDEFYQDGSREFADAIAEREKSRSPTRLLYAVFAPDGRRLYGTLQTTRPPLGMHDIMFIDPRDGGDRARGLAVDVSPTQRLLVAADREWIERTDRTVITVFAAAFAGACLLAFGGALLFGAYLRRRLRAIGAAAETIIGGDIRERMPVSPRGDEFDALAATLNRMLDRIEGLLDNLRQVSSDVAHDLRTPLARLRNRLEQGAAEAAPDSAGAAILEDAIQRVDEVLSLFAAILRIAEVESGETRRFFAPVDMSALAAELADSFAPAIHDQGRTLLWSIAPGLVVDGDRELLAQAGINLLENAQRHTPAGTVIHLTLRSAGQSVCLRIADDGPGVSEADRGRIVKRFARADPSRTAAGHGLGLNLVTAVAKLHGGRLVLSDARPGFAATLELSRLTLPPPHHERTNP